MKLNNKGFAISSVMYIILVMAIILIALTLSIMGSRKLMIDKVKDEALKNIYPICKLLSGEPNEISSKYLCEVKPGTNYNFYILSFNSNGTTNLIMDQNINSDGTPAGTTGVSQTTNPNKYNLVAWHFDSETNTLGPITAMQFLYNATKDWTNIEPLNYEYKDRESQGITDAGKGYVSFISNNGVATLTPYSSSTSFETIIGTTRKPLRARMPIYSSDSIKTEVTDKTIKSYLYENLNLDGTAVPFGYWTLSVYPSYNYARHVYYSGTVKENIIKNNDSYGVRPVITIKL